MSIHNENYSANSTELPRVAVLMSTYNGEIFIREQIESILAQEGVAVSLYVRDDGSSDQTFEILKEYEDAGNLKILPAKKNVGPGRSFMTLIFAVSKRTDFDYMAFADQDDIWLPRKLYAAVDKLKDSGETASLYGSNQTLYQDGKEGELRFSCPLDTSLKHHINRNEVSGCTMVMNRKLVTAIVSRPCPPANIIDFRIHDAWVALVAILTGTFIYDPNSYILYRIHENNTVGIRKTSIKERLNRLLLRGNNGEHRANLRSNTASVLLEYYPDIDEEYRAVLEKYAYYRKSMKYRLALLRDKEIIKATGENPLVFRLKILVNFA
ncbi:Spore coat polysaccharide biosynthesis protein spsA [uncultured Clostridium sp.]|uniref:glycosyltransferase n=1 Tax=unclassified Clostridium TaxID=2614128 RepID=UPI0008211385|nr:MULTISPECIES: glycosyltransferase [unclassified Clostridium]SCH64278.1 Spore coat polysaccharide biosynthesis protein spsA [uncultured Clostridium sp.]